jgi:hypothetical protein
MTSGRPQRQRVVLAHRRGTRMVHTRVEVQEQTDVGDALVRGLVRAQLGLALRLAALMCGGLAAMALANSIFPDLSAVTLFGIRLNWLMLGVLVYPVLYGSGALFVRLAEEAERDFIGVVEEVAEEGADEFAGEGPQR